MGVVVRAGVAAGVRGCGSRVGAVMTYAEHSGHAHYVTATNGRRVALLAGPYRTHAEALSAAGGCPPRLAAFYRDTEAIRCDVCGEHVAYVDTGYGIGSNMFTLERAHPAPSLCPSRLGDGAAWCDTHGGVTAVCTVCDARVSIVSWESFCVDDAWLIGAHQVFDPVALRDALVGVS